MRYAYKNVELDLEGDEVYMLWDIISFGLDHDAEHKAMSEEERAFAKSLKSVLDEMSK